MLVINVTTLICLLLAAYVMGLTTPAIRRRIQGSRKEKQ
jgi:hypothetical protein